MSQVRESIEQVVRALKQGDEARAAEHLERAFELDANSPEAHYWQGNLFWRQHRDADALASFERAIRLEPRLIAAHNSQGMIYFNQSQLDAAQQAFERALRLAPTNPQLHNNLGLVYRERSMPSKALACFRRAVELDPKYADARNHLGVALGDVGKLAESIACLEQARADAPQSADICNNLGTAYEEQADFARAAACYERAKVLDPAHINAHYNHALLRLRLGDWQQGWRDYEYRFQTPWSVRREFAAPRWSGEDIAGKSILLWSEQGLGDTLQFLRFGQAFQERGARVICECQRPLAKVLEPCTVVNQVVARGDALPPFDYHLPLMSSPLALGIDADHVPAAVPYVHAAKPLVEHWRERLGPAQGLRIGVHWRGSATHRRDYHRSYPFPYVALLAQVPGVQLICLQKHERSSAYGDLCTEFGIWNEQSELDEARGPFMDTAALMQQLDLVITCDTSIAHLAGALARPVWLALRHVACWRWMQEREDTPWYPTMKLYRQRERGDWNSVFQRMAADLATLASGHLPPPASDISQRRAEVLSRCVATGLLLRAQHRLAAADETLAEVLACDCRHADALCARGLVLHEQGRLAEATEVLQQAVEVAPRVPDAHNNLGLVLQARGQLAAARSCYEEALRLRPDYPEAHNNLAITAKRQGHWDEAEQHYRAAIQLRPTFAHAHYNLGNLYHDRRSTPEALACFEAALAAAPTFAAAHHNRALLWLMQGDFARGWEEYEWRWKTPLCQRRHTDHPGWEGQPLTDKTLLVYTEQGLGDTFQFVRYLPLLQQRNARLLVECQPTLVPILQHAFPFASIFAQGAALPPFDYQVPLLSLPRIFQTRLETIPNPDAYLRVDEQLVALWAERLRSLAGRKIGIHWQGNPAHPADRDRSIPVSQFERLSDIPSTTLVVLQKGYRPTDEQRRRGWVTLADNFDTAAGAFMDSAAALRSLDLVITCDSAIAHLAGALGVPTWIALPFCADWRWLLDRMDSPWYPSVKLFRQSQAGDWDTVFATICRRLAESPPWSCGSVNRQTLTGRCSNPAPDKSVQQAIQWHREGRIAEAAAQYEAVLDINPEHLDALHMGGLAAHQLGNHTLAIERLRRAAAQSPQTPAVHNHLGLAYQASGRLAEAEASFRRAVELAPRFAEAFTNLGSLFQKRGDVEQARAFYQEALERQPRSVAALYNLGLIARQQHDFQRAADFFERCLAVRPEHLEAQTYLGECLLRLGAFDRAATAFEAVLARRPDVAVAWNNLGTVRKQQGRADEAEQHYRQALKVQPDYVEAHYNLGLLCAERGRAEEAVNEYRAALARRPDYLPALKNLGHALQLLGQVDQAGRAYEQALARAASPSLRLAAATLLPLIYESAAQVDRWRSRFQREVESLIADGVQVDPLRDPVATTFFLAYQGRNDRLLHERLQRVLCSDTTAHVRRHRSTDGRLRIGFVSKHLREHTIGRLFHGLICQLSRHDFWTAVLALDPGEDGIVQKLQTHVDAYLKLPANLVLARQQITALDLDVLVYLDIGMTPASNALALSRLAPIQCVTWGHPVTTGLSTIDYFLSSRLFEPSDAHEHYTEQLVTLETINSYYSRPQLTGPPQPRARWALPETGTVYLCPQSLFKLHPDFDAAIAGILRTDPDGYVALLDGNFPTWNELLLKRLTACMPDVVDRVRFVPRASYAAFLHLYSVADVMLDPFPFGGGNTSYEALSFGLPIVTWPSRLLRGRITAGLYEQMGLRDLCAASIEQYVERAVAWGRDHAERQRLRSAILAANDVLFENGRAVSEFEQFLRAAVERTA